MNTSENDSVQSKTSIDITAPLPTTPYPPLPPIPEKVSLGDILPTVPPLPSEKTQNENIELTINPPSPPEEEKQLEKLEQRNQSANQVQDMELSDGEDECNEQDNLTCSSNSSENVNIRTATEHLPTHVSNQVVSETIAYNNHPYLYQSYYQNQTMETFDRVKKSDEEAYEIPGNKMNDALSSFYSDLASIDAPSDGCNSFDQNKSGPFQDAPFSMTECSNQKYHEGQLPVSGNPSSSFQDQYNLINDNEKIVEKRTHSPRSNTPDKTFNDEKRRKKAKVSTGLSMKKKGVSTLVAKWQNIQEESSKHRPK